MKNLNKFTLTIVLVLSTILSAIGSPLVALADTEETTTNKEYKYTYTFDASKVKVNDYVKVATGITTVEVALINFKEPGKSLKSGTIYLTLSTIEMPKEIKGLKRSVKIQGNKAIRYDLKFKDKATGKLRDINTLVRSNLTYADVSLFNVSKEIDVNKVNVIGVDSKTYELSTSLTDSALEYTTSRYIPVTLKDSIYLAYSDSTDRNDYYYNGQYADLQNHWAKTEIEYLNLKGSMVRLGDGILPGIDTFNPDNIVSRGSFINLIDDYFLPMSLHKRLAFPEYLDMIKYIGAIVNYTPDRLVTEGISLSNTNMIMPENNITREEACYLLVQLYEKVNPNKEYKDIGSTFDDSSEVSEYARPYVCKAVDLGLITPDSKNMVNPKKEMNKGEVATVIYRLLKIYESMGLDYTFLGKDN